MNIILNIISLIGNKYSNDLNTNGTYSKFHFHYVEMFMGKKKKKKTEGKCHFLSQKLTDYFKMNKIK